LTIIAELDAINLYLQLAPSIEDEKVRKVFEDVALEEKTHVGEFLAFLKNLDPEQVSELVKGAKEVEELTGVKTGDASTTEGEGRVKSSWGSFEEYVRDRVKQSVNKLSLIRNNIPVLTVARNVASTVFERKPGEKIIIPLQEISVNFSISLRDVDNWLSGSTDTSLPDLYRASRDLVSNEDKLLLQRILECREAVVY